MTPAGESGESAIELVVRRDRIVIVVALAALSALSWGYMLDMGRSSPGEHLMPCCGARFGVTLSMWVVMMIGMMLPSVAPMVLTHAAIVRRRVALGEPYVPSGLFLGGYLVAWSGFSALAAALQWALFRAGWLDGRSLSIGPIAGGVVLLLAGVFQLSSAKGACLAHCRAPLGYFMTEWREGRFGALVMGVRHGVFCVGCCWLLMALLFSVGVMNMVWSAVLTAFVLAEKVLPWRRAVVWCGAVGCFVFGGALLYGALGRGG
jgi:predicted metal-binding membrane protein